MKRKIFIGKFRAAHRKEGLLILPESAKIKISHTLIDNTRELLKKKLNVRDGDYVNVTVYNAPDKSPYDVGLELEFRLYGRYIKEYKRLEKGEKTGQ